MLHRRLFIPLVPVLLACSLLCSCRVTYHTNEEGNFIIRENLLYSAHYTEAGQRMELHTKRLFSSTRVVRYYHPNGQLESKGKMKRMAIGWDCVVVRHVRQGKWKHWDTNGNLILVTKEPAGDTLVYNGVAGE